MANARLLDKILAVIDNDSITLSQVNRVLENYKARKNISPQIYDKDSFDQKDAINSFIYSHLIRNKLSQIGYTIEDAQVEAQIKATESRLGLNRDQLYNLLKSEQISFAEYFEIIRQTIEFNLFNARVIAPLISISEQDIKNTFYKRNSSSKTLNFKYNLVDFYVPESKFSKSQIDKLPKLLKSYQATGILPEEYKQIETNPIGDINEAGLNKELKHLLKSTDEGQFSNPILMNGIYHVFFVRKKDLVQSEIYLEAKAKIRQYLFEQKTKDITKVWFQRESNKYYIKFL